MWIGCEEMEEIENYINILTYLIDSWPCPDIGLKEDLIFIQNIQYQRQNEKNVEEEKIWERSKQKEKKISGLT